MNLKAPQRETIFKELLLRLIISGGYREALDELELCVLPLEFVFYDLNCSKQLPSIVPVHYITLPVTFMPVFYASTSPSLLNGIANLIVVCHKAFNGFTSSPEDNSNSSMLHYYGIHKILEHAKALDPENVIANEFLDKLSFNSSY